MQWVILLGHFDIAAAVMSLSSFYALPYQEQFECAKQIYDYLLRIKHAMVCFKVEEQNFLKSPKYVLDWESVNNPIYENIPSDAPEALGYYVTA